MMKTITRDDAAADPENRAAANYVPTNLDDPLYFGAKDIVNSEKKLIQERRYPDRLGDDLALAGLALSGGGIRSASFALGVMQALHKKGWLQRIDYLSTVSGGGYIGACLSYLLHRKWTSEPSQQEFAFGGDADNFPLGSFPMTGTDANAGHATFDAAMKDPNHRIRGVLLRHLRQHGKYLTPGDGITIWSLIGVVLRNTLVSLLFYFALLVLLFTIIAGISFLFLASPKITVLTDVWPWISELPPWLNPAYVPAVDLLGVFALLALLYSWSTWSFRSARNLERLYLFRRKFECRAGKLIVSALFLGIIGSVPVVYTYIDSWQHSAADAAKTEVTLQTYTAVIDKVNEPAQKYRATIAQSSRSAGSTANERGGASKDKLANIIGLVSTVVGLLSTIGAFLKTNRRKKGLIPVNVLAGIAGGALLFGLALLAYGFAAKYATEQSWFGVTLAAGVCFVIGWFVNLNYLSLHRYYRDRLGETFMPDVTAVYKASLLTDGSGPTTMGLDGNGMPLMNLWGGEGEQSREAGGDSRWAPYHILNANVVLVSSKNPKFRGRGGDNFILTPRYCGSNATGWARTSSASYRGLTLASAMAISGAAVNPNAGGGGEGITRQAVLSMLMGVLNVRLGYRLLNPRTEGATPCGGRWSRWCTWLSRGTPNFLYPGLGEVIARRTLNEDSCLLELSDGGHFENLGLYELVRRKLKFIIVCDGVADNEYSFSDLANAIEKVRADFGALISFDPPDDSPGEPLDAFIPAKAPDSMSNEAGKPAPMRYAKRGHLLGRIKYADNTQGTLLYLTTTFVRGLSADLYGYRRTHPEFPDEPTTDQFFDEKQFEAYRELGYQIAWNGFTQDPSIAATVQSLDQPPGPGSSPGNAATVEIDTLTIAVGTVFAV